MTLARVGRFSVWTYCLTQREPSACSERRRLAYATRPEAAFHRFLKRNGDLAARKVATSVAMVLVTRSRDVDRLGRRLLLNASSPHSSVWWRERFRSRYRADADEN